MPFIVEFIGIILFVKLSGGGNITTYHVIMPNEGNVCGQTKLPDHNTYIRVDVNDVASYSGWAPMACLAPQTCELFQVDDATLQFGNIATTGPVKGSLTAFHLRDDFHPTPGSAVLQANLEDPALTNADIDVTTGSLRGDTKNNGMLFTVWKLQTFVSVGATITAKARNSATPPKVLTLKPVVAKPVQIVNTTLDNAKGMLGDEVGGENHFVIYYHVTDPQPLRDCKTPLGVQAPMTPMTESSSRESRKRSRVPVDVKVPDGEGGVNISCSNTQWP